MRDLAQFIGQDALTASAGGRVGRVSTVLEEALVGRKVQHPDGSWLDVKASISHENSRALNRFVRSRRPNIVIEIGMAYGVSTLTILDALQSTGKGKLISIDPYIGWPTGRLVALNQVHRAGVSDLHEHVDECSSTGLAKLLSLGARPDLVYIDGWHNFDYAFVDFFFADKLLRPGGVVAFNDASWRSVFKVIQFVKSYRKYRELDVGLPKTYASRNPIFSLIKRLEGRSTHDRYFEKVEQWEPPSGFHRHF